MTKVQRSAMATGRKKAMAKARRFARLNRISFREAQKQLKLQRLGVAQDPAVDGAQVKAAVAMIRTGRELVRLAGGREAAVELLAVL